MASKLVDQPVHIGQMKLNIEGKALGKWRNMRSYSQDHMARQLGLKDSKSYSRYETGESRFDLPMLEAIAKLVEAGSVANLLNSPEKVHIEHANQANSFSSNNSYHEASAKEREQLLERVRHLEEEILHLRKGEELLRKQLEALLGGGKG